MKQSFITKNYILPFYSAGVLLFTSCMQPMSESVADKDAGLNGGFESIQNGLPANWLIYTPKTTGMGDFVIEADSATFYEGTKSLKFDIKSCSDKGGRFSPGIACEMKATAGKTYKVSFRAKNKGVWFSAKVSAINATESVNGSSVLSKQDCEDWNSFSCEVAVPAGMNKLRFEINALRPGTLWLDDVEINCL